MQSVQAYTKERRQASLWRRMGRCWQLYLLLIPAVIYIFIFNYLPLYGIQIAFRNYSPRKGYWGSAWVGWKYFDRFFSSPDCWKLIKNTLSLSIYSLVVGFPLPIILALLLNQCTKTGFKKLVQNVIYAPHFISMVVLVGMINVMFSVNSGVVNTVIERLGGERVLFTGQAECFPHLYVWSGVWQDLGWGTIIYLATLSSVSPELHEAAYMDGANRMQIIWHVNLPCILPTVVIMLIMSCGRILSVGFEKIYLLQNSLNLDVSQVISTYTYELGLLGGQYSYSTAIGLFNTVVNVVMLLIVNTICKRLSDVSLW